jgi:hypothetical protein
MSDFKLEVSTIMMIIFIITLSLTIYKLYDFLPTKPLVDDDHTLEATDKLKNIMIKSIQYAHEQDLDLDHKKVYDLMIKDKDFDHKHFWRFNQNRLNHLINSYHVEFKTSSLKEICDHSKRAKKL